MARAFRRLITTVMFGIYEWAWAIALGALFTSYACGYLLADAGGERNILNNYFYWWVSTSTTLGYGEITPSNNYGQAAAILVVVIGLGVLPVVLAKIVGVIYIMVDRKVHGTGAYHGRDHIIIFGYHPERTEKVLAEIFSHAPKAQVLLVDDEQEKNPFPADTVEFVRGRMSSEDTFRRANAVDAASVLIDGTNDDESFFVAYGFRKINTHARLVCYLRDQEHAEKITKDLPADDPSYNQVILPVNLYLMAQELQDPESSQVLQHLFSNLSGATQYRLEVPKTLQTALTFEQVFIHMKQAHDAIVIALKGETIKTNPKSSEPVRPGDAVFYIANRRLRNVDWQAMAESGQHRPE